MAAVNILKHDLTFLHIPKNGGSSIVQWLGTNFETEMIQGHLSLPMLRERWDIKTTFTTVRNPWARVVSSYFYLKQYGFYWDFNNIKTVEEFPSWDEYVKNFAFKITDWNTLTTNQYEWMGDGVDIILKCENLNTEFKVIQDRLNCYIELPVVNTSEHSDYRSYYTTEQKERVGKIFEKDIEMFGYQF